MVQYAVAYFYLFLQMKGNSPQSNSHCYVLLLLVGGFASSGSIDSFEDAVVVATVVEDVAASYFSHVMLG